VRGWANMLRFASDSEYNRLILSVFSEFSAEVSPKTKCSNRYSYSMANERDRQRDALQRSQLIRLQLQLLKTQNKGDSSKSGCFWNFWSFYSVYEEVFGKWQCLQLGPTNGDTATSNNNHHSYSRHHQMFTCKYNQISTGVDC
jgi:hypothetical protein